LFNHLLPHSSTSNNSPFDRKAMVLLCSKSHNNNLNKIRSLEEKIYRNNFVLNSLNKIINNKKIKK